MNVPNPATILKDSIKSVPAVKWALGIAGIISIIAIVTVGWKINPMVAVLGTIVMLVLMTVLVVFAKLSTTAAIEFRYPIQVFMWASLCLTIAAAALLFTSVFFQWPLTFGVSPYRATSGDKQIWDLQDQMKDLRGTWETVHEYGEDKRKEVLERATKLGQELLDIDDNKLGPSGYIIKRETACYVFIMAATTETYRERRAEFAHQAIGLCSSASDEIRSIFESKHRNRNVEYTVAWAKKENQKPYVDYLLAMATCLEGTSTNDQQTRTDAINILHSRVPTFYLNRYPPERDSVLTDCVETKEAGK